MADDFVIDDTDDLDEEAREAQRLRQVRRNRQRMRRLDERRSTSRVAALGVVLCLCGAYAGVLAYPRYRAADWPAAMAMTLLAVGCVVAGRHLLSRWRRLVGRH
ncbi:MAG: hypothetical protein AAF561_12915 [Planctomycetota bacterium]